MNSIYTITLIGKCVLGCRQIIGFIESNDKDIINSYIEKHYNVSLTSIRPNKFNFQNGCHWTYNTTRKYLYVHVDLIYNIK